MATIQDRYQPSTKMRVNPDGSINTSSADVATIIDEATYTSTTFFGYSNPGTSTASSYWQIKIIDESGSSTEIKWADGNSNFNKVWDNRTSYTYY